MPNYTEGQELDLSQQEIDELIVQGYEVEIPKFNNGGTATRADSLDVLKSTELFNKEIERQGYAHDYTSNMGFPKTSIKFENNKVLPTQDTHFNKEGENYLLYPNTPYRGPKTQNSPETIGGGHTFLEKTAPYKYDVAELASYQGYNTTLPKFKVDSRIIPQGITSYNINEENHRDYVDFPYYDPLAITPWDQLNADQRRDRILRYGVEGSPYVGMDKYKAVFQIKDDPTTPVNTPTPAKPKFTPPKAPDPLKPLQAKVDTSVTHPQQLPLTPVAPTDSVKGTYHMYRPYSNVSQETNTEILQSQGKAIGYYDSGEGKRVEQYKLGGTLDIDESEIKRLEAEGYEFEKL